jgi:hypothetical protein
MGLAAHLHLVITAWKGQENEEVSLSRYREDTNCSLLKAIQSIFTFVNW